MFSISLNQIKSNPIASHFFRFFQSKLLQSYRKFQNIGALFVILTFCGESYFYNIISWKITFPSPHHLSCGTDSLLKSSGRKKELQGLGNRIISKLFLFNGRLIQAACSSLIRENAWFMLADVCNIYVTHIPAVVQIRVIIMCNVMFSITNVMYIMYVM